MKNNIVEKINTLWVGTKDTKISLTSNIAKHGEYIISVSNENGCKTEHKLITKTYSVENINLSNNLEKYCYGDSVKFIANADNAKEYMWINENTEDIYYGYIYNQPIKEQTDYLLIVTENILECKDSIRFSADVCDEIELIIGGKNQICVGDNVSLNINSKHTDINWYISDSLIGNKSNILLSPEVSTLINVTGKDANNCISINNIILDIVADRDKTVKKLNKRLK